MSSREPHNERVERHTVEFQGFEIPVVVYREYLLGSDPFTTKYAVREPDRLPGDEELINACKERVWETVAEGPEIALGEGPGGYVRAEATAAGRAVSCTQPLYLD